MTQDRQDGLGGGGVGTAMGLAILGSVGAGVILADWHRQSAAFPQRSRDLSRYRSWPG